MMNPHGRFSGEMRNPSGGSYAPWLKAATYALVCVYLLNCISPLRLHVDMLRYFAIKDCVELGCPPDSDAARDYLPYGYTGLLLILSKLHILHSFVIVLINCVYLFGGLWLVTKMFGTALNPFVLALLVLLNWTVIKFVTHPLSEMQYIFFSMGSLYFFYRYTQERRVMLVLASFACGALAFLTRSVGVALAATLVAGLVWQFRNALILLIRRHKILVSIISLVVVGVIVFSRQLGLNHYTGVFNKQFNEGVTFSRILKWHFTEWSEIGFNTSIVKLLPFIPAGLARMLFIAGGILLFVIFGWLLFIRRNTVPFIVKAYLFFYFILMFDWPFYDPRFWVPVLPLVAAVIAGGSFPKTGIRRMVVGVFLFVYIALGIVSVGYMTYTSLNRKVMARTQANGVYRNEYETVFFGKPQSDTARHIDNAVLSVIKRYN